MISLPFAVVVVLATWLMSAGITYGVLKTKVDGLIDRLEKVESQFVPRNEYTVSREDVTSRLERIERKIDALH